MTVGIFDKEREHFPFSFDQFRTTQFTLVPQPLCYGLGRLLDLKDHEM